MSPMSSTLDTPDNIFVHDKIQGSVLHDVELVTMIALDDDIEDWPPLAIGNLVACDGTTGLSDPEVRRQLRQQLMAKCDSMKGSRA